MGNYAKILSLSYDAANATITSARKTYYRSVRLIKDDTTVNPGKYSKYTNVLLCGNCIDPEERNLYVFYIDTSVIGSAWIIEINIDSRVQAVVYYDKYNAIGFSPLHKIYNARVVHGRIVWTDDFNPIYQMDIKRAKKSFYPGFNIAAGTGIGYGENAVIAEWSALITYATNRIVTSGNNFYQALSYTTGVEPKGTTGSTAWRKLCLIEDAYYSMDVKNFLFEPVPPKLPPTVTYLSDPARKINNLRQTLFQVAYRWVYMDWRRSTFSPASLVPVPQAEEETATGLASEDTSLNNALKIFVDSGGEEVRAIEIVGRSSDDPSKWFLIETIDKFKEEERRDVASGVSEISGISEPGVLVLTITVPDPIPEVALSCEYTGGTATIIISSYTSSYHNVAKSGSYIKNNCGAGNFGSVVVYTVPAAFYTSLISQADADALAQANVDANGQTYANTNGTCTAIPPDEPPADPNPSCEYIGGSAVIIT